jgi:predicted P-loop ATPase
VPHLKEAGVEFKPGSHNNYVMRIGYLLNEYGIPMDSAMTWAAGKFGADYPQTANIIANCYAAQPDEFGKAASLVQRLNVGYKPSPDESGYASVLEIEEFLSREIETRRNLLKDRLEYRPKRKNFLRTASGTSLPDLLSPQTSCGVLPTSFLSPQNGGGGVTSSGFSSPQTAGDEDGGQTALSPQNAGDEDGCQTATEDSAAVCHNCNSNEVGRPQLSVRDGNGSVSDEPRFEYLTDVVVKSLWVKMSHERQVKLTDIYNVLESDFSVPYNPLHEYLRSLRAWTPGQPDYIAELAGTVTVKGDESEQQLFAEYLKKWLVGMVAAWLNPEVVNHVVLVFIGAQGVYKSTWFNHLLPPELKEYYCVKFDSTNLNKDDLLLLSQNALVGLEEIDVMTERIANFFKATVTATNTNVRAAYARYAEQREHVASYCGTGNNPQFLNEAVSRRWLPFIVEKIISPLDHPFNHEGIFSQALHLYRSGFRYWFNAPEIEVLNHHNRDFQTPSLEEELISCCFRKPGPEEIGQFFPTSLILKYIADNIGSKLNAVKVGQAMRNLGFKQKKSCGIRGWICIPMTPEEMVAERKRRAMDSRVGLDDGKPVLNID